MHKDIGPYFELESFHYMQASLTNQKHAQNSVETARTILQKKLEKCEVQNHIGGKFRPKAKRSALA